MICMLTSLVGLSARAQAPLPVDETWLDREAVSYFASGLKAGNPFLAQAVLGALHGARVARDAKGVTLSIYFKDELWIQTVPAREAAAGQVYRIEVPEVLSLRVESVDGVVRVDVLNPGKQGLRLKAKIPFMPDQVYVHGLEANLATGVLKFRAGVLADWLVAVAVSSVAQPLKGKIDIAATILETLPFLKWKAIESDTPTTPALLRLPGPEMPELREWKFNNEDSNVP
jgi:hypothetical protein